MIIEPQGESLPALPADLLHEPLTLLEKAAALSQARANTDQTSSDLPTPGPSFGLNPSQARRLSQLSRLPAGVLTLLQEKRLTPAHAIILARLVEYPDSLLRLAHLAAKPSTHPASPDPPALSPPTHGPFNPSVSSAFSASSAVNSRPAAPELPAPSSPTHSLTSSPIHLLTFSELSAAVDAELLHLNPEAWIRHHSLVLRARIQRNSQMLSDAATRALFQLKLWVEQALLRIRHFSPQGSKYAPTIAGANFRTYHPGVLSTIIYPSPTYRPERPP